MMNTIRHILYIVGCSLIIINWSSEETSEEGRVKQRVNFSGIITTQAGKQLKVENIAIGRTYKQIKFYELPEQQTDLVLSKNPVDGIISQIDLSEIKEMRIPHPDQIWTYQQKPGSRPVEYIEIEVISNDTKRTKHNYLIDMKRDITCDEMNDAGPIEKKAPFNALKSLIITGYEDRDLSKARTKKCPPCELPASRQS